ncbi:restriction system protein [Kushneria sinocarnis]|uniref:Restriction system protein n=1 Tax=Kushneria sinocarnis TaxID=595502 RepID=A0A420X1S7_9GAMM|nr:restriction endonuclease [Kushneria sinocarnis]RKR07697.1 restriction system protein [Kushneria sinocarnis]
MPIPDFQSLMHPLLLLTADGHDHLLRESYTPLAEAFELSAAERHQLNPSGQQYLFNNRVTWAASYLRKAGLLTSRGRGVVAITEAGQQALAETTRVDLAYLMRFDSFREFRRRTNGAARAQRAPAADELDGEMESLTPLESMEVSWRAIRADLEGDMIERMQQIHPARFEQLVIDVLITMGYGCGQGSGQSVGQSSDGGIDGVINEDPLGLETIYLQAKRWTNPVGRPDIQKFSGALAGRRARKGVFITTSHFTREAQEYVTQLETRLILIDGQQLARLMIDHNVGVTTVDRFEIKRLDSDYFLDE